MPCSGAISTAVFTSFRGCSGSYVVISGTRSGWCLIIVVSFSMGWAGHLGRHRLPEAGQTRRARKPVASVDDRCPGTEDEVRKDACLDAPRLLQHPWIWSEIGGSLPPPRPPWIPGLSDTRRCLAGPDTGAKGLRAEGLQEPLCLLTASC